jgi:glycosyltransferase involved in cell wall biosynthesis
MPLKFSMFFLRGALHVRQAHADLVHTIGAIVPNRVDLASVHFCHAGFNDRVGSLAPPGSSWMRRVNSGTTRLLALLAERWCYRRGRSRILAPVSAGVGEELARHYPTVPVVVTPNGVDTIRFRPDPAVREAIRGAERAADSDLVSLFVGGDWDRKGLEAAIRGLALAQAHTPHRLLLWVVGRGDERRFGAVAETSGLGDQVRFFGVQSEPERHYQAADIFLFPTLYEAFSLVTLEAAACGLPLIATRVSGIEETVGHEEAGLFVQPEAGSIAAAVTRLAADPVLRRRLGAQARARALLFTWDQSVSKVLELYRQLLPASM